jgi:hypothetical protein
MNTQTFPFAAGLVTCDLSDGAVLSIAHPAHPGMSFLLNEDIEWHQSPFRWGKGFLLTDCGGARWDHPSALTVEPDRVLCRYNLPYGLVLDVQRTFGAAWTENYTLTNTSSTPITLGSFAISTPYNDLYRSASDSLNHRCHAHIWTGGGYSYVWAIRMNGEGPGLGLKVTHGELWSYSIESRHQFTGSNTRGHIYLHVTDAARAPHAMGGQPRITLSAGASYSLSWQLGWFDDFAAFERLPFTLSGYAAPINTPIRCEVESAPNVSSRDLVSITETASALHIASGTPGIKHIDLSWGEHTARIGVLFHQPLQQLVETRIKFIMQHQQATERASDRVGAFLPYDNRWQMRVNGSSWRDWSDARERLAMPLLLQEARLRGWGDSAQIDEALRHFDIFCREHLVGVEGDVFEDSFHRSPTRLYNFPWLAEYCLGQYLIYGREDDLLRAALIVRRYYAAGGSRFLAFWTPRFCTRIVAELRTSGHAALAQELVTAFVQHADYFAELGVELPSHEVNYEQSIVAPLLMLCITAYGFTHEPRYAELMQHYLPWLLAFNGQQPHVRLKHIPLRHWDGYWFGATRMWGDVFPHYWSILTAHALASWAADVPHDDAQFRTIIDAIYAANLAHFKADGSATCAFVYPSCVNGNPAYMDDPLANDQDWALVYILRDC